MTEREPELDIEATPELVFTDGRLFCNEKMYCEGRHRPVLRGYIHLVCFLVWPFAMYKMHLLTNGNNYAEIVVFIYGLTNLFNKGCSAVFHIGNWSLETEILLQKIDHSFCSVLSAGVMLPLALLVFPSKIGNVFIAILIILCTWNIQFIIQSKPSVLRQLTIPGSLLLFMYPFYNGFELMTNFEIQMIILTIITQFIGVIIYANEMPNFSLKYFGYHELFHVFEVISSIFIYLINISIIERCCYTEIPDNESVL